MISIHALREEGDLAGHFRGFKVPVFLSTPSARRATPAFLKYPVSPQFLSTPSARRATLLVVDGLGGQGISIHALREEGDLRDPRCHHRSGISIHALREEGDPTF